MRTVIALLAMLLAAGAVSAADKSITLPDDNAYGALVPGPGDAITRNRCVMCHSTDYVVMQPRGDAKQWQAVVTKMIKVFGAPVDDADAKAIVEYLTAAYGPAK